MLDGTTRYCVNISHVEAIKITRITHRIAAMAPPRKWRKNSGRGVKGTALREIRKVASSSEDEGFLGFKEGDTKDNKVLTDRTVIILQAEQSFHDEYALAGPSADNSGSLVPKPAPHEDGDTEIVFVSDENDPLQSEFPQDLLYSIPDPQEDPEETTGEITYTIREAGTARGNPVIESSDGYTFSFQKNSKGKTDPPRYRYYTCIKRQYKKKDNCAAKIRIEKFEDG